MALVVGSDNGGYLGCSVMGNLRTMGAGRSTVPPPPTTGAMAASRSMPFDRRSGGGSGELQGRADPPPTTSGVATAGRCGNCMEKSQFLETFWGIQASQPHGKIGFGQIEKCFFR
uniref:Uncharacterized protein n=1 Tax=Oryza sativa subsp. japonica TaxID=39947 RepID=Q53MT4_ORYSJ|nr:hypothetical protein LOC_Os11g18190 [Oryza sativa Japonica Group]